MFSELYDNEWTDAFEELDNKPDEDRISMLLQILEVSYNNHGRTWANLIVSNSVHVCVKMLLVMWHSSAIEMIFKFN